MNAPDVSIGDGRADVLAAAVALRWSRPDLTRILAEHLMEQADARGDRDAWLVAAGWRVDAAHCIGDGREPAADALEQLQRWDDDALHSRAAGRLRVALACVAHDAGDLAAALLLAAAAPVADPELAADRLAVLARLSTDDDGAALAAAESAWEGLPDSRAGVGVAGVLLLSVVSDRRTRRAERAVTRAVAGLNRLDRARGAAGAPSPAGHLAAALAAEWIAALVDAGRWDQAKDVIAGLAARLGEPTRPTRQLAYLRSMIARVLAVDAGSDAAGELERAARDATAADVPDLEHVCRVALGELHEAHGHIEPAVESVRLAVLAERRHQARSTRLRAALAAVTQPSAIARPPAVAEAAGPARAGAKPGGGGPARVPGAVLPPEDPGRVPTWNGHPPTGLPDPAAALPDGHAAAAGADVMDGADAVQRTAVLTAVTASSGVPGRAPGPWATGSWGRSEGVAPNGRADRAGRPVVNAPVSDGNGLSTRPDGPGGRQATSTEPLGFGRGDRGSVAHGSVAHGSVAHGSVAQPRRSRHRRADPPDDPFDGAGNGDGAVEREGADGQDGARQVAVNERRGVTWEGRSSRSDLLRSGGRASLTPATDRVGKARATPGGAGAGADEDQWLVAALAELDRIRRAPVDQHPVDLAPDTGPVDNRVSAAGPVAHRDDAGTAGHGVVAEPEPDAVVGVAEHGPVADDPGDPASARGCVVVLDLTRGAGALPDAVAAATMRSVAARLADHLPPGSRLRADSPGSRAVVMPGSDRAAASAWLRGVVPDLAEGLVVDDPADGVLLRASVHGTDGLVGAQMLQRLGGVVAPEPVTRTSRFLTPGPVREDADTARAEWMRGRSARLAALGIGRPGDAGTVSMRIDVTAGEGAAGEGAAGEGASGEGAGSGTVAHDAAPVAEAFGTSRPDPKGPAGLPRPTDQRTASARRPYLPDGVVVRPGSGGRRHRREAGPAPVASSAASSPSGDPAAAGGTFRPGGAPPGNGSIAAPATPGTRSTDPGTARSEPAGPGTADGRTAAHTAAGSGDRTGSGAAAGPDDVRAHAPVDGLGLADLLAGALAEYRRI